VYFFVIVVFLLQLFLLMFVLFGSLKWQRMIFFLFDERLEGYLSNVTLNVALFKLLYCVCSVVIRGRIHSFHGQLV